MSIQPARNVRNSGAKFFRCSLSALILLFASTAILAQSANQSSPQQQGEVEQLRNEVQQLRGELDSLRALVEKGAAQPQPPTTDTLPSVKPETADAAQSTSPAQDSKRVAVATKSQGGDLAGAGNLLRTDRITIGGYGDAQFRTAGINERAEGGGTPSFVNPRFVLGVAAVLSERHNIFFNSEIEYEFAGKEVEVEQAFVEWKARPEFAFRGGILVPALGRFNVYHDSNLNLSVIRPLINQFIVPTAYSDMGLGIRGRLKLSRKAKLSYEFDVVNGMRASGEEGEAGQEATASPFSRLAGQAEAAVIGELARQDNNRNKAIIARLGLSPFSGLEFGVSGYRGRISDDDEARVMANIFFLDASFRRGNFIFNGEYARSNILGNGIARRSPQPPVFNPNDGASADKLADYLAQPSPGQDGFYIESSYQFRPRFIARHFDEGGYIAPVIRFEAVRLDRTLKDFYLNRSRATLGLNIAPSSTVIFKLNYLLNHTFGTVPGLSGELEEEFSRRLLPFKGYGRNGFSSSITYVF